MIETVTDRAAVEINRRHTPERLQNIAEWAFKRYTTMKTIKAELETLAQLRPRGAIGASSSQSLPIPGLGGHAVHPHLD
jgi:acyl carrier protein phosphodiesterase